MLKDIQDIVASDHYDSPFGRLVHSWSIAGLHRLRICGPGDAELVNALPPPHQAATQLSEQLHEYFHGVATDFSFVQLDTSAWSTFYGSIYRQCQRIPHGQTVSYGQLAESAGRPKAARAVGQAMARNRVPIVVPCHRVIGSSGQLVGFSAPGGLLSKRRLIEHERGEAQLF